jgi:7-keto-8-aminopelargonate synthetase-like enzyme
MVTSKTAAPVYISTNLRGRKGETTSFPSSSGGLFNGYFSGARSCKFSKNDLIDARGRRLFETTSMACNADAYPFQIPLEARTGPEVKADGHSMLMLSSYDYLGLIGDPRIDGAAIDAISKYGTGTGGARLLTGTTDQHLQMERDLAAFRRTEAAITFSSGYAANVAVIGALFGPADRVIMDALCHRSLTDACRFAGVQLQRFLHNDVESLQQEIENGPPANRTLIITDELNHASIIDGARLSKATIKVFKHKDVADCERILQETSGWNGHKLIITDGVFSMDGDICRLPEIIAIKKKFGCYLLVDDAHATGVLGAHGRGVDEHFGIAASEVDIWTGSLAKAIPSTGGFVAGSQELAIFLQHAASPYIFSAALSPASVAAIREGLSILAQEPERVARIEQNASFLRCGLKKLGYDTGLSETAVIPVILKDEVTTALFARRLRDNGILAVPVLFPAVPQGAARLRLCVTAAHTRAHLEFALDVFKKMSHE